MAPTVAPCAELNNGQQMPLLGLGTYKSKPGEVEQAVKDAIDVGYRHIDAALIYQNESEVGAAIRAKISDGTVKREDLFVVTKLWNIYHNPLIVAPVLKKQLKTLGLDYVDLYLIHWPVAYADTGLLLPLQEDGKFILAHYDYVDTYKAMEECVKLGLTKSIGLSNFNSAQIQRVLDNCTIKPVTNQVESHPWVNQDKLNAFCKSKGLVLTGYAPLGSPDRPWAKPGEPALLDDPKVKAIAEKHGKSPAQVCLRFQVQRGIVCIPKSVTKSRIEENMAIFDFELSAEEIETLNSFDRGLEGRMFVEAAGDEHEHYPFRGVEF